MGLYGSLVSLDADGEHVHPIDEEAAHNGARRWFYGLYHRLIDAVHHLTHH